MAEPNLDDLSDDDIRALHAGDYDNLSDKAVKMLHEHLNTPAEAPVETGVAEDVAKTIPSSIAKGAILAVPGISDMMHRAANRFLFDPLFNAISGNKEAPPDQNLSSKVVQAVNNNMYQPRTGTGQVVDTIGQMVPQALLGEASALPTLGRVVTQAVVPGLASEAAGKMAEGTAAEPWVRAGAAMLASHGAGTVANKVGLGGASYAPTQPIKNVDEVQKVASQLYNDPFVKGLKLDNAPVNQLGDHIVNDLERAGVFKDDPRHSGVFTPLKRLQEASGPVTLDRIDSIRQGLGSVAGELGPDFRPTQSAMAASRAKGQIDAFISKIGTQPSNPTINGPGFTMNAPHPTVVSGNPTIAAAVLDQARKNAGAAARAETAQIKLSDAQADAATQNSAMNLQNKVRQKFKSYIKSDEAKMAGWTPEEQDATRKLVFGQNALNTARTVGNMLGGGLGLSAGVSGATIGSMLLGPHAGLAAMAVPAAGWAMKKLANYATANQAKNVANLLLERAPVNQPIVQTNKLIKRAQTFDIRRGAIRSAAAAANHQGDE